MILKRKLSLSTAAVLALAMGSGAVSAATSAENAVYALANGCYALKSPATGKFLESYHRDGAVGGPSYRFNASSLNNAEKFFFKPTAFSEFILSDSSRKVMAGFAPREVGAVTVVDYKVNIFANWRVKAVPSGPGYRFTFWNQGFANDLWHDVSANNGGGTYFVDILHGHGGDEKNFELVPATGCTAYPEADLSMTRTSAPDASPAVGTPVRGAVDAHAHLMSWQFMGGKFLHGQPFNRLGIGNALDDGRGYHGPSGALDIIGNLMGPQNINARHDTRGYPTFKDWPKAKSVSHQIMYYRWIERAFRGGLKIMNTNMVQNEVLCGAQSKINPKGWFPRTACNTMENVRLQIANTYEMQDYIDAQAGGPGKGFFRIVRTSDEARQVISEGKMAVLLGVEASEMFNCGLRDAKCTRAYIDEQLDTIYNLGIRSFFPIHRFDNQFGGARMENGFINVGQWLSSGHFFTTKKCTNGNIGMKFTNGFPLIGNIPVFKQLLNFVGLQPQYDENIDHCNVYGLTDLGVYLVNRMIDKGMLIEIDHMSYDAANQAMQIAEARNYSGVVSVHSHNWFRRDENAGDDEVPGDIYERIAKLGGYIATYNFVSERSAEDIDQNTALYNGTPFLKAAGLSTDANGLANQAEAREDNLINPIQYPFTTFDGMYSVQRQKTGNRTFDFNEEGFAHYGLWADRIEDMRIAGTPSAYDSLLNSAEAYLQFWKRAETNTNRQFSSPFPQAFALINHNGKCLDIPGNHKNNLQGGEWAQVWECDVNDADQRWSYDRNTGRLVNNANRNLCLDNWGQRRNDGALRLNRCNNGINQKFDLQNNQLLPRGDHNFVVASDGDGNGAPVRSWHKSEHKHGHWSVFDMNTRPSNGFFTLVNKHSGKCADVASVDRNANVSVYACNNQDRDQVWFYSENTKKIHNAKNPFYCLDNTGAMRNGGKVHLYACVDTPNQQFEFVGDSIRASKNKNFAVTATGTGDNSDIQMYAFSNGSGQRWQRGAALTVPRAQSYQLVNGRGGRCMDVPGVANQLNNDTPVINWDCNNGDDDMRWLHNPQTGMIHNFAHPGMCLDSRSTAAYSQVKLWPCVGSASQQFDRVGQTLRLRSNHKLAITSTGDHNNSIMRIQWADGSAKQNWTQVKP